MRHVEAGRTDDCKIFISKCAYDLRRLVVPVGPCGRLTDVERLLLAVFGDNGVASYLLDRALCEVHIRQEESLQVALARGDSAAAEFPFRNQLLAEFWIVIELFRHLVDSQPVVFDVFFRTLNELLGC